MTQKKRIIQAFLFSSLFMLFNQRYLYAQGSLSSGLVMYLPFNGSTMDVSGKGHHAINLGATPAADKTGAPNTAYYFNGAVHMEVPHHADLNPRKFSVCAKVKVQGFYNGFCYNNIIMTKGLQRTPGFYSIQHTQTQIWDCNVEDVTKHNYRIDVQNISTPLKTTMDTKPYLIKDNWDCVVGTFDGDTAKMYVNGVFRFLYYEPGFSSNTDEIMIGFMDAISYGYPFYFTGTMDEIRIYDRALTEAEITTYCGYTTPVNTIKANFKDSTASCLTKQFTDLTTFSSTAIKFWNWEFGDGGKSTLQHPSHTYPAAGSYTVKLVVVDSFGYKDSISKLVTFGIFKFANAGRDTIVCSGSEDIELQLFASGGASYSWSPGTGLSNPNIANPIATIKNTSTYIVTAKDKNGCEDKDTITITVKSGSVKVDAFPSDTSGCVGTEIQLSATGAVSYLWQPPSGLDKDNIANPKLIISGVVRYVVTGTDSAGCAATDTITVKGFTLPKVDAKSDNTIADCNEKEVLLTATGAETYEWYPAIYCDNSHAASTNVRPPATSVFSVKGIDKNGCINEDTITVFYEGKSSIRVPNAFSPNNDGINDKISPIIVCDFILTEFTIYNRWGKRIFSGQSMSNPWNGTLNGTPCDVGVYYYYIKGKNSMDEEVLFKGDITLIR